MNKKIISIAMCMMLVMLQIATTLIYAEDIPSATTKDSAQMSNQVTEPGSDFQEGAEAQETEEPKAAEEPEVSSNVPNLTATSPEPTYTTSAGTVSRIAWTDKVADSDYWDYVGIPTSYFTISNNGGSEGSASISNAFDRNTNTYWKSYYYNNGNQNGSADFHNTITADFNGAIDIDRVLYAAVNEQDGKGYPNELKIYLYRNGECIRAFTFSSQPSTSLTMFDFGETVNCDELVMEWVTVNKHHYYNPTAREIVFLQPDMEKPEIFTDFCKLTLSEDYDTAEELNELKQQLSQNVNYESSLKAEIERAEKVLSGELTWNRKRQMSVTPTRGEAILRQEGDMYSYMRNTLQFGWYGTNKQVLGVSGQYGETITIWVDAEDGDPLPKVIFSQYFGHFSGWQTGEIQLSKGKNVLTVPYWDESKLTWPYQHTAGGPIYIANPYTPDQQSSTVKVYVEGGSLFPVFRKGEDEAAYKAELAEYVANRDTSTTYDLTELESDYTQMTVQASLANTMYNTNGRSPQQNLVNWDDYMRYLLAFDGVEFDTEGRYYDERNEHLRLNFRLAQPYGAAFGANSQVGIFYNDWVNGTLWNGGTLGWGFAHEIGHTMDTWKCLVSECTNNMISKYDETMRCNSGTRGFFTEDINALASDRALNEKLAENPDYSYFDTNRMNYLVWWHIESIHPGTWGTMKNLYRYPTDNSTGLNLDNTTSGMSSTEKQIYLMSLASGVDLGSYFERYGYRLSTSDAMFHVATASAKYTQSMQEAVDAGLISRDECTKYWYLDGKEYRYVTEGKTTDIYSESDKAEILSVKKTSAGYNLLMPKSSNDAHLGYEILEGSEETGYEVIGFTNTRSFTDSATYEEGYTPSYKVVAIDRGMNMTAESDAVSAIPQENVCRINDVYYNTLGEAVNAAVAGDTIFILKDVVAGNITINKNLTITANDNVTITKAGAGNIFNITSGTLIINGNGMITIDGDNFEQNGSLIYLGGGGLTINSTKLCNNDNTGNGGAICAINGPLYVDSCTIENCKASNGGAIAIGSGTTAYYISNSTIRNNTATGSGGGICSLGGGIIYSLKGTTVTGNTANSGGGLWLDGWTKVDGATISNNTALNIGGGIWMGASNDARKMFMENSVISGNKAANGGNAIYIDRANTILQASDITLSGGQDAEPTVYIKQGKSLYFGDTDLPVLELPDSQTIGIEKTSTGIYINYLGSNSAATNIGIAKPSTRSLLIPEIRMGSERKISTAAMQSALDHADAVLVNYYVGKNGHVAYKTIGDHDYCTGSGTKDYYTCVECDKYFSDPELTEEIEQDSWKLSAQGHQLEAVEAVNPGCETEGYTTCFICKNCGKHFFDGAGVSEITDDSWKLSPVGHNMVKVEANEANYDHEGNTEYWFCSRCGKFYAEETHEHELEENSWILSKLEMPTIEEEEKGDLPQEEIEEEQKDKSDEEGEADKEENQNDDNKTDADSKSLNLENASTAINGVNTSDPIDFTMGYVLTLIASLIMIAIEFRKSGR